MNIRMSTKGKRPLRSLNPSDKVHAIQRIHDGESKASVARDIGVPESTLRGWCKNEDKLRFMSRQSAAEKMGGETLTDKLDGSTNLLSVPQEKRQRMDSSMPLNFSNKMKFDELTFKRAPLSGLDFGGNKSLSDINAFNGLPPDYGSFNGSAKNKVFGADISRPTDPSIAAISPLSSLSHLSGLTGLSQSPLAISFNELTSNLSLLAQLNPGLAAMTGLNSLASSGNNLRAGNLKSKSQIHSPRNDTTERHAGLTVKNWAKQKPSTPTSSESPSFGLNLSQSDTAKSQLKSPSTSLMLPQLGTSLPPLPPLPEDPLLYWLKSQQAMLGLNNLYPPPPPVGATSPPVRSSTPQQQSLHASTPPIVLTPLTPSSTPSGSLDDKNSAWFNWCKAFGASLNSLAPAAAAAVALHGNPLSQSTSSIIGIEPAANLNSQAIGKSGFENILYSQLTKDSAPSPSVQSSSSVEQINCEMLNNVECSNKPEDLSAKTAKANNPLISPLPTPAQSPEGKMQENFSNEDSPAPSPVPVGSEIDLQESDPKDEVRNSVADCRDVLDNLLYKINSNNNTNKNSKTVPQASSAVSESEASYNSDHINTDDFSHNNNNNSNKTDEEVRAKCTDLYEDEEMNADYREAISNGEKFLQWLENCSNPRVTAVQLMQLRFLISSVKTVVDPKSNLKESTSTSNLSTAIEIDDSSEESNRSKMRRRK